MKKPRNIVGPVIRELRETLAKIESRFRWVADSELVQLADALKVDPGLILKKARK